MSYAVLLKASAERELTRLPDRLHDRIVKHLLKLSEQPRPPGSRKLQGTDAYRLRVGDYRVLYEVDDQRANPSSSRRR